MQLETGLEVHEKQLVLHHIKGFSAVLTPSKMVTRSGNGPVWCPPGREHHGVGGVAAVHPAATAAQSQPEAQPNTDGEGMEKSQEC